MAKNKRVKKPPLGRAAKPARNLRRPKSRCSVAERKRGGDFLRTWKAFVAIHRNHNDEPFTKTMLAEWLRDDLDRDLDDLAEWFGNLQAAEGTAAAPATPAGLRTIKKSSRDRNAERVITSLGRIGFIFTRCDENGRPLGKTKALKSGSKKKAKGKSAAATSGKVWWKYDPNGPVSMELERLTKKIALTDFEIEGIMGCTALLESLHDLPMIAGMRPALARLTVHIPKRSLKQAADQALVWRFMLRRAKKYATQKKMLQAWNDAAVLSRRCMIKYAPPGEQPTTREVVTLGTMFMPEEESIFLIGCEQDKKAPGKWMLPVQYKLDRVSAVEATDLQNPKLADLRSHYRVDSLGRKEHAERIDLEKLYEDSAGAFFHYGPTIKLVVRVHDPRKVALCKEMPFHRRQRIDEGPRPGEITLTVDRCFLEEVVPRLLRLENGFTVIEPPEVVEAMRRVASEILARHGGFAGAT